ncbi:hypothetical protein GGH92_008796, partial [Coemansia sp. RSA 2673]
MRHSLLPAGELHGEHHHGEQWWLSAESPPCGSRPSSVVTEPYMSNSLPLSPSGAGLLTDETQSLAEGCSSNNESSPIAAERLYGPQRMMASLCLHSSPDEEGPLEIQLYSGRSAIGGASGTAVCLARALAIDAAVEIGDGLHVLYDYGSAGGVFLGHRRARVRPGVGYVLSDGKLVWFGQTCFWYRVLDDLRKSPSPPPPWRMPKALPDARPRAARLRREIAAAAITHSPPQQPLLSGLRMDALSVDEVSAMASDSDAEPSNPPERRPATPPQPTLSPPARSISPPAQSISPPTQPVSPSRRPPQLAQTTSGLGVAALNAKDTP